MGRPLFDVVFVRGCGCGCGCEVEVEVARLRVRVRLEMQPGRCAGPRVGN